MRQEVQIIISKGDTTSYQSGIYGVDPSQQKIYISETVDWLGCDIYQQLIDNEGFIDVYGESGFLGTVQVDVDSAINCAASPFSGTLRYISDNPSVIASGAYFRFTLGSPKEFFLDLYENESISQNWNFTDISDFKVVGSYSRQFRIPLTQRNQEALGAIGEANYLSNEQNDTVFNTKIQAEIRVNTLPIIKGHLRIIRAFKQLDKLVDVEVSFYSETPDLFRSIGDKKLKDITTLSELNHTCDTTSVFDNTQPYLYSLIDRGQKWDNTGTVGSRPINSPTNSLWAADFTPSVKWSWLFDAIIHDAGFTYEATDLMNVLDTYYMPFINRPTLQDPEQFKFGARIDADQSITSGGFLSSTIEVFDNDNVWSADTFTAPATTSYTFILWVSHEFFGLPSIGRIIEVYMTDITTGTDYLAGTLTNSPLLNVVEGYVVSVIAGITGHQYRVKYKIYNGAMLEIPVPQLFKHSSNLNGGCSIQLVAVGDVTNNIPVFMSPLAPNIKQIDFIKDVITMHNLVIIPDKTQPNRFIFQSIQDYIASGERIDWTNKLDISKDIVIESTTDFQKRNINFTYSLGGDVASKFFNDVGQRTYGDYKIDGYQIDADTPSNQFVTGDITLKLTTQSTPAQIINGTSYAIPKFINDKGEYVNPAMRCLFVGGSAQVRYTDGFTDTEETIPLLSHYSVINADYTDNDLNFAPETPLHDIVSSPYNNLFNLYWRNYLNALYSPQARLMTANFALDLVDILTFSFSNLIWIKDSWWRILEINDYKIGDSETTNVKLLKVVDTTAPCNLVPVGSLVNGQILWEDADGNPATGTELCCDAYDWFWSPIKSACYSNIIRREIIKDTLQAKTINEIQAPVNSLKSAVGLNADTSSQYSAYVGADITVGSNNIGTLAVGRHLILDADKRGAVVLGKNVLAKTSGLHLGGGWITDSGTNADGGQQFGIVIFSGKDNIAATMDTMPLYIEGITGNHIELENETSQVCTLTLNIQYDTFSGYAVIWFRISKDAAGVCTASSPVLFYQESDGTASANLVIDTTTNPTQHRLLFQAYGTGFPYSYIVTGSLQYIQLR